MAGFKYEKNPQPQIPNEVANITRGLLESSSAVSKLYCLLKIDKPTYNLSKWLTEEVGCLPIQQESFSAKSSLELKQRIK